MVELGSGDAADAVFRMGLFGPGSFNVGGRELRFKSLKLRAALGYIALNDSLTETRERLVGLLWSESPEEHARASLRQNIREFRVALQGVSRTGVYISQHEIGFERGAVKVDVWGVIEAAETGKIHPLLLERPNLADELLAGLEDLDPAFRSWLLAKRHTIRDRLLRALENALTAAATDDVAAQGKVAQAILNLDPTHEEAVRAFMRARATVGDTAGALRAYKTLWDLLDEDYGMEPAEATQKLVADIKIGLLEPAMPANRADAIMPAPATPLSERATRLWLSVPKVMLRNVDPAKTHLVLEFHQQLIGSLVRFREWQVTDAPTEPVAEDRRIGIAGQYEIQIGAFPSSKPEQSVQILVTLKDLDSMLYIWSESFELDLERWFVYQRHVVRRIAMGLNVHLSAERLRRFSHHPDVSLGLYDRWLRCQTQVRMFNPRFWQHLKEQFAEIVREAPTFAPAFGGLADLNNMQHIAHPGVFRTLERDRAALAYALEAVRLDPSSMSAHKCLAWCHSMTKQFDKATMHIEVALELNPNDSWNAISAANLLAFAGNLDRGSELAALAMDMTLAPSLTHWAYNAEIHYLRGDYEAALHAADLSHDVIWDIPAWRAAALAMLGRSAEAQAEADRFIESIRSNWFGPQPATPEAIMRWHLHIHPINRREEWIHLRDGLARAGLPTDSIEHGTW
jgi:DNA-binding SARP family transcriptional activator